MIKEIEIEGEKVNMKKDFTGWRIVYPIKDTNGKYLWKNILFGGSYWNILKIAILVGLISFAVYSYRRDIQAVKDSCVLFKTIIKA